MDGTWIIPIEVGIGALLNSSLCSRIRLVLSVPLIKFLCTMFFKVMQCTCSCLCFMLQFPLEYGAVLILVKFVLLEAVLLTKDWWRCTVVDSGELCVMMHSAKLMLTLFVDSWDMIEHLIMTTLACEKCFILFTQRFISIYIVVVVGAQVSQSGWMMFHAAHRMFV